MPLATLLFLANPFKLAIRFIRGQIKINDYISNRLVSLLSIIVYLNGKISRRIAIILSYYLLTNKLSYIGSSSIRR
jgi:hypothetical protein